MLPARPRGQRSSRWACRVCVVWLPWHGVAPVSTVSEGEGGREMRVGERVRGGYRIEGGLEWVGG